MNRTARRRPAPRTTRTCPLGKARFRDHRAAVAALHQAVGARRHAAASGHTTARREVRCYECVVCSGYHLTSQPTPVAA